MAKLKSSYYKLFLIASISWLPSTVAAGMPTSEVVLTEMLTTIFDPDIVAQNKLLLISHDGRNIVNYTMEFKRNMRKLIMQIKVDFEKPDKTRLQMLDITTDTCNLLTGKLSKQKFMQTIIKEFAKQKSFILNCPFQANRAYSLVNFSLRLPQFPLPHLKFIGLAVMMDENNKRKISEIRVRGITKRVAS